MSERNDAVGDGGTARGGDRAASRRAVLKATGLGVLSAGVGTTALSAGASAQTGSFLRTDGTDLVLDGETIHLHGSNNFWLMDTYYGTPSLHDTVLSLYDRLGLNFVRTWGFRDGTSEDGPMLQPEPGTYDEAAFERFDSLVAKAGEYGVKLVLPLVNNWTEYGGKQQYVEWVDGASGADAFYTNPECRQLYKDYVEAVLTRENTITGVEYRNDPAIAVWELANEPRAPNLSNNVEQLGEWIEEMSAHVKSLTADQLVSTGMEGFYADSDHGNGYGYAGAEGTDYVAHHEYETIDLCSYHIYPIAWGKSAAWATDWIAQHQTDAAEAVGKPAYCGEFGLSLADVSASERDSQYRQWYDAFDEHDADGTLLWQIDRGQRAERVGSDEPAHGVYADDAETLSIVREYGARARAKSDVALEPDAPHAPTGVALTGRTATSIDVVWDATVGWGVGAGGYEVTLDGAVVAETDPETTATTLTGLDPATEYAVTVRAVDANGDASDPSAPATLATLPEDVSRTTDPCEDLSNLADAADAGSLTTDTSNAEYFVRPDGETDGARINRSEQGDAALVYAVDGRLLDLAVEFHANANEGGSVEYYESADGGDTWQSVEVVRTVYDGPGSGGWSNELHSRAGFSAGVDRVRIVLTGGSAAWSGQVGAVELTYAEGGTPTEDPTTTSAPGPRTPGPVGGGSVPGDPDRDGLYEDVNGNERQDIADAVDLFQHRDEVDPDFFDFTGDGSMNIGDAVQLFRVNSG